MIRKPDKIAEDKESAESTESSSLETRRRKALKNIAVTTGIVATMSAEWKKPVIDSVILPAHADGSDGSDGDDFPSDMRIKKDIRKIGQGELEVQLYRFEYRNDPDHQTYVGVMAQHLLDRHPDAVRKDRNGLYHVSYPSLGLRMTTLERWNDKGIESVIAN